MHPEIELTRIGKQIGDVKDMLIGLARRPRAPSFAKDINKVLTCHYLAGVHRVTAAEVAESRYSKRPDVARDVANVRGLVQRSAVSPAMTFVPGWAAELAVARTSPTFFEAFVPMSAYTQLTARSPIRMEVKGSATLRLPTRLALNDIAGEWVGEGKMIPVKSAGLTSVPLAPKKVGVISFHSDEMSEWSSPNIEQVVGTAMRQDTAAKLDQKFLSDAAATTDAPAGLRHGIAALTSTSPVEDVALLLEAIEPAGDPVLLMSSANAARLLGAAPGLAGLTIITTTGLPTGVVMAVDAGALASAEGDDPELKSGQDVVLQTEDPVGPLMDGQTISVWQQSLIALRLIQRAAWTMRAPGSVAWTTADWTVAP